MFFFQTLDRLNHRMVRPAGRIELDCGTHQFPRIAQFHGEGVRVKLVSDRAQETEAPFENLGRARESINSEPACDNASVRRPSAVQPLDHCPFRIVRELHDSGSHTSGNTE